MAKTNPWAKIKDLTNDLVPPVAVLREQAQLLSAATDGVVQGDVQKESSGQTMIYRLRATVPVLDYYAVELVRVAHEVTVYPCKVRSDYVEIPSPHYYDCANRDELEDRLAAILADDTIQEIVASLIVQAT